MTGENVTVQALHNYNEAGSKLSGRDARSEARAVGGGSLGTGGATAVSTASATVKADMTGGTLTADGLISNSDGTVTVQVLADNTADAKGDGEAGGIVGIGEGEASATTGGTTQASLSGADANNVVNVTATSTNRALAEGESSAGGVVGGAAADADARARNNTQAFLRSGTVDAEDDVNVTATATRDADAIADGAAGGAGAVGAAQADARVGGWTKAYVQGGNVFAGTNARRGDIEIFATSTLNSANADADAAAGGLVSGTGADANAFVESTTDVEAYIGNATIDASDDFEVKATGNRSAVADSGAGRRRPFCRWRVARRFGDARLDVGARGHGREYHVRYELEFRRLRPRERGRHGQYVPGQRESELRRSCERRSGRRGFRDGRRHAGVHG